MANKLIKRLLFVVLFKSFTVFCVDEVAQRYAISQQILKLKRDLNQEQALAIFLWGAYTRSSGSMLYIDMHIDSQIKIKSLESKITTLQNNFLTE